MSLKDREPSHSHNFLLEAIIQIVVQRDGARRQQQVCWVEEREIRVHDWVLGIAVSNNDEDNLCPL